MEHSHTWHYRVTWLSYFASKWSLSNTMMNKTMQIMSFKANFSKKINGLFSRSRLKIRLTGSIFLTLKGPFIAHRRRIIQFNAAQLKNLILNRGNRAQNYVTNNRQTAMPKYLRRKRLQDFHPLALPVCKGSRIRPPAENKEEGSRERAIFVKWKRGRVL